MTDKTIQTEIIDFIIDKTNEMTNKGICCWEYENCSYYQVKGNNVFDKIEVSQCNENDMFLDMAWSVCSQPNIMPKTYMRIYVKIDDFKQSIWNNIDCQSKQMLLELKTLKAVLNDRCQQFNKIEKTKQEELIDFIINKTKEQTDKGRTCWKEVVVDDFDKVVTYLGTDLFQNIQIEPWQLDHSALIMQWYNTWKDDYKLFDDELSTFIINIIEKSNIVKQAIHDNINLKDGVESTNNVDIVMTVLKDRYTKANDSDEKYTESMEVQLLKSTI